MEVTGVGRGAVARPPVARALHGGGIVRPAVDALAQATGSQACMQINPAHARCPAAMLAQHGAQRLVAPGRRRATKVKALGKLMLPARDGGLPGRCAMRGDVGLHRLHVVRLRWPRMGQQQRCHFAVSGVDGKWLAEVVEIAVQVHVLVRGAAQVRKPIGVERMDVQHGHALGVRQVAPLLVVQRKHLHATAAKPLHPMAAAAHDEQLVGVGWAIAHHVHGQVFAIAPQQRMAVRFDRQAGRGGGLQELRACTRVGGSKRLDDTDHGVS